MRRLGLVGWGAAALAVAAVAALAVVLGPMLGGGGTTIERMEPAAAEGSATTTSQPGEEGDDEGAPGTVVVHVDGAVAAPGVYELVAGARASDAVEAAGGLTAEADTTGINLAAPVADGEKVQVPVRGEAATAGDGGAQEPGTGLVNLNTADVGELDELPGVGEATARAIVEDREANGPFSTPEDLMRVSGIGEKKFARIEGMVCV